MTGAARYTADVPISGAVHAAIVHSTIARGWTVSIDTAAAGAAPGVLALFTHRNTILNRLALAEKLLPAPLAGRGLEVGLALEIAHWLGAGT